MGWVEAVRARPGVGFPEVGAVSTGQTALLGAAEHQPVGGAGSQDLRGGVGDGGAGLTGVATLQACQHPVLQAVLILSQTKKDMSVTVKA